MTSHVHDEASMKLRSFDPTLPNRPVRSRQSKIQNNCVHLHLQEFSSEWFQELQPMLRKDGPSRTKSLSSVISGIARVLSSTPQGKREILRCVHVLTGDSVNTNENAVRRLLFHFVRHSRWEDFTLEYRLVVWRRASHLANLCTMTAIRGT